MIAMARLQRWSETIEHIQPGRKKWLTFDHRQINSSELPICSLSFYQFVGFNDMVLLEKLHWILFAITKADEIGATAMSSGLLHRGFWKHEQNLKKIRKLFIIL
jgi:hypothetical protein